jgi:hypothetical protein
MCDAEIASREPTEFGVALIDGIPPPAGVSVPRSRDAAKEPATPEVVRVLTPVLRPNMLSPLRARHGSLTAAEPSPEGSIRGA